MQAFEAPSGALPLADKSMTVGAKGFKVLGIAIRPVAVTMVDVQLTHVFGDEAAALAVCLEVQSVSISDVALAMGFRAAEPPSAGRPNSDLAAKLADRHTCIGIDVAQAMEGSRRPCGSGGLAWPVASGGDRGRSGSAAPAAMGVLAFDLPPARSDESDPADHTRILIEHRS